MKKLGKSILGGLAVFATFAILFFWAVVQIIIFQEFDGLLAIVLVLLCWPAMGLTLYIASKIIKEDWYL